ncbi:hypothetical protein [Aurantiacibacter gangjinensis]|uniref:Uncharacterized protein n=1 Tax=Aurantiacibacter gangjinensis TaxID=502682 RepID=A0A0G9MTE5_9SPHN|nr:hypothetical protein [Aurantiacibacter gangjinensis]APE28358.1 hypothetical protein BMF35_a1529 [Aurantiacibacter gangjinensis]KLE32593.1 hypothetical protein AAW01_00520 [Aurantiacibacter gangjinensis]
MPKALTSYALAALAGMAIVAAPASAIEVDRQEVAERFAEGVEQQRRVYCRDTRLFTLTDGTERRACIDWRAQNRTRLIRTYASLDGPENDAAANLDIARDCFDTAVASANDPYRERFDESAFLAAARTEFARCVRTRNLQQADQYSLSVYETGVWLGGSWEDN